MTGPLTYDSFFIVGVQETSPENLLSLLRTKNGGYKRYLGSPLRYAGGKSWAVGYIAEHIPRGVKRVVSPFFGGGSLEIALSKVAGFEVLGYDIFDILVNYWQVQISDPEALYQELSLLKPDKETYEMVKSALRSHWRAEAFIEDNVRLAAYYYFNHNLSYGPGFLGWLSSVYANEEVYRRMLEKVRNFSPGNLWVEVSDFRLSLPEHKNDFLYLDPPYYLGEESDLFIGLYPMRNFPVHHHGFPHLELRNLLDNHRGGFLLSYNDSPVIREWYKDFRIVELRTSYTMGQGETRVGKNRMASGRDNRKVGKELLIIGC